MSPNQLKTSIVIAAVLAVSACSNGGGSSDTSRSTNTAPSLLLSDGDVLGGGSSVVSFGAGDDTGIARVNNTLLNQGRLPQCAGQFADDSLVANSLIDACVSDLPALGCAVTFEPVGDKVEAISPPLYAPIGLEYEISVVDRDGSATDPVRAFFCFDVGANTPPVPVADTFQIAYSALINKRGVSYDERCEKRDGSEGVLANDEDDQHVTNTCLKAVLVEPPRYASNSDTFSSTFRSDGGFVYESFGAAPPEDASGRSVDSFTYRVTDGVNPDSDPVRVEIVFINNNVQPVASDDTFDIAEDSDSVFLSVLDNDTDPDGLPLSISSIFNGPGSGIANIRQGVQVEYRPGANFVGEDRFSYTAVDSGGLTVTADVVINVQGVNDVPVAQNDAVTTNENVPIEIRVRDNDTDTESDPLTVVSVANPFNGTAQISSTGNVLYTPNLNYSGPDSFEYTITDGADQSTATVIVQVVFVNVAPSPVSDELFMSAGTFGDFNLLSNDSDGDGDPLTLVRVSEPGNGTAELLATGDVRYTPNAGYSGVDTFSYTVSDGTVESTVQVTVQITAVNDVPLALSDSATTAENTPVSIDVVNNDTDPDGNDLSVVNVTAPASGAVIINADGRSVTYTPAVDFSGQVTFNYTIDDGNGGTATAVVTVVINDTNRVPVATDDTAGTQEDDPVLIPVLNNDSDPDGDPLSVAVIQAPANGTARAIASGAIRYTPAVGFVGDDTFRYSVTDSSGLSAAATVTVSVNNTNDAPVANDDSAGTNEDTAVEINVQANDSDPDGDLLTVAIVQPPASGSAQVTASGAIQYVPIIGFSGSDTFRYSVTDPSGLSASASVTVSVDSTNEAPVAVDDTAATNEDVAVEINVQANDSDPDGDTLTVQLESPAANGTATVVGAGVLYTPRNGFAGADQFVYSVTDPSGASDTATVNITVSNVNQDPVAVDDTRTTEENDPVSINVLANDSDPDGDALTLSIASAPSSGFAAVNAQGTRIIYSPINGFSGQDGFVYQIEDGNGGSATATVIVTVTSLNVDPVALDDQAVASQGIPVNFNILANDNDGDGDTLTVSIATPPENGTAIVLPDNRITYTSLPLYAGADTIVYSVDDGNGGSDTATVNITVQSVNTVPEAVADTAVTDQAVPVEIAVLVNDADPDGDALTVSVATGPGGGAVSVGADNQITYTPSAVFSGIDSFTYTIDDGRGGIDTAPVTITVNAVVLNQAPIAIADAITTDQDVAVQIDVLGNDTDPDNDLLNITGLVQPQNGIVTLGAPGILQYVPAIGFFGIDSFSYEVSDPAGAIATAAVEVTVNEVVANVAPVALADSATTLQDVPVDVVVLFNDSDADGDLLAVSAVTDPSDGTAVVNTDNSITYTPSAGFNGADSFEYTVTDGVSAPATAAVTITVTAPVVMANNGNSPPVAVDDAITVRPGSTARILVLNNDSDADGDSLSLSIDPAALPTNGDVVLHNSGKWFNYQSDSGYVGLDSFGYIIDDGNGASDNGLVTIAVISE